MSHYKAILERHKNDIRDTDWITFVPEHSVCHPEYLAVLKDYTERIGATENISCIVFPRRFVLRESAQGPTPLETEGDPSKEPVDAKWVEKRLQNKCLKMNINFREGAEQNETYEIHELVVRAGVVKEFFRQTLDSVVRNKYCDVEFSVFVTEHGRVVKGESALWLLYTGTQGTCPTGQVPLSSSSVAFGLGGEGVKLRNMYEAAPLLTEYAEMWHIPQLQATADQNFQILLDNFADQEDALAFFKFHFERAKQEKPWLQVIKKE